MTWDNSECETPNETLRDLTFSIKTGQLIAIVGRVGSGKSSLISAIAGNRNLSI